MPAPSCFDGLSWVPPGSGWAGTGAASTSCGCLPCVCRTGTDPHLCACSQHGAASGATRAKTCRTQHASAAQGEPRPGRPRWPGPPVPVPILIPEPRAHPAVPCCIAGGDVVGCPRHPLAAGRAGHGSPAYPALQRDAGCGPHAAGHGHRQPQRGGWRGDAARLEPAARCVLGQGGHPGAGGTPSHVGCTARARWPRARGSWLGAVALGCSGCQMGHRRGRVGLVVLGGQG